MYLNRSKIFEKKSLEIKKTFKRIEKKTETRRRKTIEVKEKKEQKKECH